MSVVTIPYEVKIPYGILECNKNKIKNIVEKPSYTYFSNAGIYLIKKRAFESNQSRNIFKCH